MNFVVWNDWITKVKEISEIQPLIRKSMISEKFCKLPLNDNHLESQGFSLGRNTPTWIDTRKTSSIVFPNTSSPKNSFLSLLQKSCVGTIPKNSRNPSGIWHWPIDFDHGWEPQGSSQFLCAEMLDESAMVFPYWPRSVGRNPFTELFIPFHSGFYRIDW